MSAVNGNRYRTSVALPLLVLVLGCGSSPQTEVAVPFPAEAGIKQGLSLAALKAGGWRACYEDAYVDSGTAVSAIVAGCTGRFMMLACRPDAVTDTLPLAAADARGVVVQEDPAGLTGHHAAHGVGWYRTDNQSWGFFPAAEPVNRDNCDTDPDGTQTMRELRLCWHAAAGALAKGFRCGDNQLNDANTWRRLVLVHP